MYGEHFSRLNITLWTHKTVYIFISAQYEQHEILLIAQYEQHNNESMPDNNERLVILEDLRTDEGIILSYLSSPCF